ncbi:unnamed protein product [Thelazia callipaeda]|uniref:C2H2-type domain-containing protein n=1 Tax=Thelazia callipaeda TaxID=103827 RepID=A0A0N5D576_THECL|nr:unnamed protein product [Thelazia callipaeda]
MFCLWINYAVRFLNKIVLFRTQVRIHTQLMRKRRSESYNNRTVVIDLHCLYCNNLLIEVINIQTHWGSLDHNDMLKLRRALAFSTFIQKAISFYID